MVYIFTFFTFLFLSFNITIAKTSVHHSGFIRTHLWHLEGGIIERQLDSAIFSSNQNIPRTKVSYQNILFRNRLKIHFNKHASIYTKFDIGTLLFGADDIPLSAQNSQIKLGKSNISFDNINLYLKWNINSYISTNIGIQTFQLPGGFVLAENGAGLLINIRYFKNIYFTVFWIKVYENSLLDFNNDGIIDNNFYDQDVLSFLSDFQYKGIWKGSFYYIYNGHLTSTPKEDIMFYPKHLHWMGFHSNVQYKNFIIEKGLIGNFGTIVENNSDVISKNIIAFLFSLSFSYNIDLKKNGFLKLSFFLEGATGSLQNASHTNNFQYIAPNHSRSYIFISNNGGRSLFNGGRFSGLYTYGIFIDYQILKGLLLQIAWAQVHSFLSVKNHDTDSTCIGDEISTKIEYKTPHGIDLLFLLAFGIYNKGYTALTNYYARFPLIEIVLGIQLNYSNE